MATKELVTKVWIEDGCIVCDACETASPDVFEVLDDSCVIRPDALNMEFTKPLTDSIIEAAEECPVDVIKFDTVAGEAPDAPAPAADAPAEKAVPAPAAAAKAPASKPAAASEPAKKSAAKSPAKQPVVSVAGDPDPAIQALLRAATARGGAAGIAASEDGAGLAAKAWDRKSAADLPPDARQAKVMSAAKAAAKDGVTRRGMLASSACGVGWLAMAGTTAVSGIAFGRFMMPNVLEEPDPKVRIGPLSYFAQLPPGGVNNETKLQGFWMIRVEDKLIALNIICTHLGCIPSWLPNDRKFKCPCHGSGFRQTGINFEGPAPRPLERFKINVIDGIVVVDRSKKFQYEKGQWDNPDSFLTV